MLDELIEAKGHKNILNEIETQGINGLYVRVPLDREINKDEDIVLIKKKDDLTVKNEKLFNWFKERKRYSEILNQKNKEMTSTNKIFMRKIRSSHINSIILNSDKIFKIIEDEDNNYNDKKQVLIDMIKDFCEYYKKIFAEDKEVDTNFNYDKYYLKAINVLIDNDYIKNNTLIKINIYLDKPIEEYKILYNKYLNMKLLEGESKNGLRRCTLFATSNAGKPYVCMSNNIYNNDSAYNTTVKNAIELKDLKQYLTRVYKEEIEYKNGLIKYESNKGDIVEYEYYPTRLYDLFKDNVLRIGEYEVDTAFKFRCQINNILDKSKENVKGFEILYEKYYTDINNENVEQFKSNYNNIIRFLYRLTLSGSTDENTIKNLILFNIYTLDYFFNKNTVKEFKDMKEKIINKIKSLKETGEYIIEDNEEYWYMVGTLVSYLTSLSKVTTGTLRLKTNYCNLNKPKQILDRIMIDLQRYSYRLESNSRCLKIVSAIQNYSEDINEINKLKFHQGLFESKNVMYVKNEENKNDKGEM